MPTKDIQELLRERPKVLGLRVPGTLKGSPGMEMEDNKEPFKTLLMLENGKTRVFKRHV